MGTRTTNLSLYKPDNRESGWGGEVNTNFDTLDAMFNFNTFGTSVSDINLEIDNDGSNHAIYTHQDGVLAANKYSFFIYSNAAQINSYLGYVHQDNASSTADVFVILNDGSGTTLTVDTLIFEDNTISSTAASALTLTAKTGQAVSIETVLFDAGTITGINAISASSTLTLTPGSDVPAIEIDNNFANHGIWMHLDVALAANKYGLYLYSNVAQINSYIGYVHQDNAASTSDVFVILNDGSGNALTVDNLIVDGNDISSSSGDVTITPVAGSDVVIDGHFEFDGAVLTAITDNDTTITAYTGKNITIESITIDGGAVTGVTTLAASNTATFTQAASNTGIYILSSAVRTSASYSLYVNTDTNNQTVSQILFRQNSGSGSAHLLELFNNSSGATLYARNQAGLGAGRVIYALNNDVGDGVFIDQVGIAGAGKYPVWIYSNTAQVNSPLLFIESDNVGTTTACIKTQQDGVTETNFKKHIDMGAYTIWESDGTQAEGNLTGVQGDICLNGSTVNGGMAFCDANGTNWTDM